MEDGKNWLLIAREHAREWEGLIAGFALVTLLCGAVRGVAPSSEVELVGIWIFASVLWVTGWCVGSRSIPSAVQGTLGIVIAVETEERRQRVLLENDLCRTLARLLNSSCSISFSVIHLPNKTAVIARSTIERFFSNRDVTPRQRAAIEKNWLKLRRKTNGHLFVVGSIRKRFDEEEKYLVDLEAAVVHSAVIKEHHDRFQQDFHEVFPREHAFRVNEEVKGIKELSERLYLVTRFSAGVAALFSRDPYTALKLHSGLKEEIERLDYRTDDKISRIHAQIENVVASESFMIASDQFYNHKNYEKALQWLDKALPYLKNNYRVLNTRAYLAFVAEKNVATALHWTLLARRVAGHDRLWLYNKAFLYMYGGNYRSALRDYNEVARRYRIEEERIAADCIEFNANLMTQEPEKVQLHYVIAFLFQHALKNYPMAAEHYRELIEKIGNRADYRQLHDKAEQELKVLDREMGLADTNQSEKSAELVYS